MVNGRVRLAAAGAERPANSESDAQVRDRASAVVGGRGRCEVDGAATRYASTQNRRAKDKGKRELVGF